MQRGVSQLVKEEQKDAVMENEKSLSFELAMLNRKAKGESWRKMT